MDMNDDKTVDKDELVHFFSIETGLAKGQAVYVVAQHADFTKHVS